MSVKPVSQNNQYKRSREKILKLIDIVSQQFPPQIQDMMSGESLEELKKEMAAHKDELPEMVEYCKNRLGGIRYYDEYGNPISYGYYEVIDCVDYVMSKMKTHKVKIGAAVGFLQGELGKQEYWYILPPIIQRIVTELSTD